MDKRRFFIVGKRALLGLALACSLEGALWSAPSAECRIWLEGDSTLHAYHSTATRVEAQVELAPPAATEKNPTLEAAVLGGKVTRLEVAVPIKEMKSGKNQLDKNMYEALKEKSHPRIEFRMERYEAHPLGDGNIHVKLSGSLAIAGVQKPVDLEAKGTLRSGRLELVGNKQLLMTDFGIKPPVMMLGALKTRDPVRIHYQITIGEAAP